MVYKSRAKKVKHPLEGACVMKVRPMTKMELDSEGWDDNTHAFVFNNGIVAYPSKDDEGNGSGVMFGRDKEGKPIRLSYTMRGI